MPNSPAPANALLKLGDALITGNPNAVGPLEQLELVGRGLTDTTIQSAKAGVANIVDIPGALAMLAGLAAAPFEESDRPFVQRLTDPRPGPLNTSEGLFGLGQALSEASDEFVGELTGDLDFSRPELAPAENLVGIMASAVFGGPVPFLDDATRAVEQAPKIVRGAVKTGARALELLTPYTTPFTAKNVAANALVQGGLDQSIRLALDAPTIGDTAQGIVAPQTLAPPPTSDEGIPLPTQATNDEVLTLLGPASIEDADGIKEDVLVELGNGESIEVTDDVVRTVFDPWRQAESITNERIKKDALAIGGVLAALGASVMLRGRTRPRFSRGSQEGPTPLGESPSRALTPSATLTDKVAGAFLSVSDPVVRPIRRSLGNDVASNIEAEIGQRTRFGGIAALRFTLKTGRFADHPDLNMGTSVVEFQERFAGLPDSSKIKLQDGLLAADEIDNRLQPKHVPAEDSIPTQELRRRVNDMRADPVLRAFENDFRRITTTTLRYAQRNGLIDDATATQLLANRPGFMPRVRKPDAAITLSGRIEERLKRYLNVVLGDPEAETRFIDDASRFIARNVEEDAQLRDPLNPVEALEQYVSSIVLASNKNRVQQLSIDALTSIPELQGSFRRLNPVRDKALLGSSSPRVVRIKRNGKIEAYEFADPSISHALQFTPHLTSNSIWSRVLFQLPRRTFQQTTTGLAQPFFSIKSLIWDASFASVVRERERAFGIIDQALKASSGGRVGLRGDPTVLVSALTGVGRDIGANMLDGMSRAIIRDLEGSSNIFATSHLVTEPLRKLAGDAAVRRVADRMRDAYLNSTRAILESHGGYNTGLLSDPESVYRSAISSATTRFTAKDIPIASSLFRAYRGIVEGMHNGSRVAFFAQNFRPDMSAREVRKLVDETRRLTGDFTESGGGRSIAGQAYRGAATSLPFANVTMQATRRFAQALIRDTSGTVAGAAFTALWSSLLGSYLVSQSSDEIKQWWADLPAWKRISSTPIITGNMPADVALLPIAPELILTNQIFRAGVEAAIGIDDGSINSPENRDLHEAFMSLAGLAAPPIISAGAALSGQRINTAGVFSDETVFEPVMGLRSRAIDRGLASEFGSEINQNVVEAINSIFGTASRMTMTIASGGVQTFNDSESGLAEIGRQMLGEAQLQAIKQLGVVQPIFETHLVQGGSPVSLDLKRKGDKITQVVDQVNIELNRVLGNSEGRIDVTDPLLRLPPTINDPKLLQTAADLHNILRGDPVLAELTKQRAALIKERELVSSNRANVDVRQRQRRLNELRVQQNEIEHQQHEIIMNWEQRNGISIEDLVDKLRDDLNR